MVGQKLPQLLEFATITLLQTVCNRPVERPKESQTLKVG